MATGVDTDARVHVLGTREDGSSEREAAGVMLVFELVPDVTIQVLAEERLGASGEDWEAGNVLRAS